MPDPREPSWLNWARNQRVYARDVSRPRTLAELQTILREASRQSRARRVRAVATGLSFSDILQTDDWLVVLTDLLAPETGGPLLPLEEELWHDPIAAEPRVRIIAGARIRELNDALAQAGLGFTNLGGYDAQTFIGAVSTSTHGSGLGLGPLPDAVRSIDLVSTDGVLYRIEPAGGITCVDKLRRRYGHSIQLVQDDTWFDACRVSLGCLGVIYSMTVAVRPAYRLQEHRSIEPWSRVREELCGLRGPAQVRNYEVSLSPYQRRSGEHSCLVTRRSIARPDLPPIPLPKARLAEETLAFRDGTQKGLVALMQSTPRLVPTLLEAGLDALATEKQGHLEDSYRVYNIGKINTAEVLSIECFLPTRDDMFLKGIDRLLAVAVDNQRHHVFQTSPLSLRFIAPSRALLSMAQGTQPWCSVEISNFTEQHGAVEALLSYEQAIYEFGGRMHWGQLHQLTGARGWLAHAYPDTAKPWLEVFHALNARHVFDNAFTDRLNLWTL